MVSKILPDYKNISKTFMIALRHYLPTWRQIAGLITLFCLLKAAYTSWLPWVNHDWIYWLMLALTGVTAVLLFGAAFYRAVPMIADQPSISYQATYQFIKQRSLILIGAAALLTILVSAAIYGALHIAYQVTHINSLILVVFLMLLISGLLVALLLYGYYVLPLLAVTDLSILTAFVYSAHYAKTDYYETFWLYGLTVILVYLLVPITWHSAWLREHYLFNLFEWAVLLLIVPLLINMILITLQKLQEHPC